LFGIGTQELLVLFLVVLLLFGADKIPEVARALGKSIRDFRKAAEDIETEIQQVAREKELLTGGKDLLSQKKPDRRDPREPGSPPSKSTPEETADEGKS